jgi:hypothetical protein
MTKPTKFTVVDLARISGASARTTRLGRGAEIETRSSNCKPIPRPSFAALCGDQLSAECLTPEGLARQGIGPALAAGSWGNHRGG